MDTFTACELAYKNGYEAGVASVKQSDLEMKIRFNLAYEQLAECHTQLCKVTPRSDVNGCEVLADLADVMNGLLNVQVKLGMLKREEDMCYY